jgi:hypothetical protein
VWTVNDGPQKVITFSDDEPDKTTQVQDGGLIDQTLNRCLEKTLAGKLIEPNDAEFASATPEAHRKGEKAYHVKAFRGSKDGEQKLPDRTGAMLKTQAISSFSPRASSSASKSHLRSFPLRPSIRFRTRLCYKERSI